MKQINFNKTCVAASLAVLLSACGGGGGATETGAVASTAPPSAAPGTPLTAGNMTISGLVVAGPTTNADVSVFAADSKGMASGTALGTAQTDTNGKYSINFTGTPNTAFVIVASGGTYISEADKSAQKGAKLSALLDAVPAGNTTAVITPLSHLEAVTAQATLAVGNSTSVATALAAAHVTVNTLLASKAITAPAASVTPDFMATTGAGYTMAALLGFAEQLRKNTNLTAADLYPAFADDISDGKLDGLKNGAPVLLQSSGKPILPSTFTTQLTGAANDYATANPITLSQALLTAKQAQLNGSNFGLVVGSSGAITVVDTTVYFAARTDGVVKLDMSNPTAPVSTVLTAINQAALPLLTSIDGIVVSPVPINAITYGILYSYGSSSVVLADLTNNKIVSTIPLMIKNSVSFSNAFGSVAGGIFDGANHTVWLATGDGLLGIDLVNPSAAPILIAQPTGTTINENIGGDVAHGLVISPDYNNNTLVIFNLNERKAYTTPITDWQKVVALTPGELDGVAVDSNYRLAMLTPEFSNSVVLVNYNEQQIAGATIPVGSYSPSLYKTFSTGGTSYSGSAVDSLSHYALLVGEGNDIGVGLLDDPSSPSWLGFKQFVNAGYTSFSFEPHDPHAVAVFNLKGKPYGFLMSGYGSNYTLLSMDLQGIISSPALNGTLLTDPVQGAFVKQTKYKP